MPALETMESMRFCTWSETSIVEAGISMEL